ncbi:9809_t:CDS:2 [Cetraspora pellucida]|uniref:9809_t:CDS:1 n=1 Tax=Cetraspora pellucida TaxID=1433469 RepID=A0ACA9KQD4_9GLOM|nr:9809_t:CDS:2 [Cetraspora pellucida]
MDGPPAQSLGVKPIDENVTRQPSRKKNAPILTPALIMCVLTCSAIIVAGTLFPEQSGGTQVQTIVTAKLNIGFENIPNLKMEFFSERQLKALNISKNTKHVNV